MEDWEKILDDLEKLTNMSVDEFIESLGGISKEFYEKVTNSATMLKLRIGTDRVKSKDMAENLKKLSKLNAQLSTLLKESGYNSEVKAYMKYFEDSKKAINDYYTTIIANYKESDALFESIRKANIDTTSESLLGAGIDVNYLEPVKKILKDVVLGNGDYDTLKKSLKDLILGNETIEPRLKAYSGQVANDAIRQFQRNYFTAVSEDLGLEHYLYRGTQTRDSRDFCVAHHGRFYEKETVQNWPSRPWKGMAKGTNENTIFTYVGGYNCAHTLIPVSKTIYEANK
jgi:hypothetical protein